MQLGKTGSEWEPAWKAAVSVQGSARRPDEPAADEDTGWTAEVAIPIASLPKPLFQPPAGGVTWRFNIVLTNCGNGPAPAPEKRIWYLVPNADPIGIGARRMPLAFDDRRVDGTK